MNKLADHLAMASTGNSKSRMSVAASLVHRALNRPLAQYWVTRRFDPIFIDGPSLPWLRMNVDAYRRFRTVDARTFTHVGMFSFSRAGSHLFESQFHYIRSCFCFGEAHLDFRNDLNWRTFLCRGMYRTDSIQDKNAEDLTHLFYNCNKSPKYLDHPQWAADEFRDYRRKWILVIRNPLRVLLSRQATMKKKWLFSEAGAAEFFDWFMKACTYFARMLEQRPVDIHVVSVEQFVKNSSSVLEEAAKKIGLDAELVRSRPSAQDFFRRVSRTGEQPVVREGYLASPTREIAIKGWGGEFNPLLGIDADRLYKHDIVSTIPADVLRLARSRLGDRAFDFYVSDRDHQFIGIKAADLLRL